MIRDWLGLIRFSHTIFALPFALLATVFAYSMPLPSGQFVSLRLVDVVGVVLCMVFARSAAMAFNRLVDAGIDAKNPRTAMRHLPAGRLQRGSVVMFTVVCAVAFVASTLAFLPNWLPLAGSVPVLLFLLGYSFAKRFTAASHAWLGIALSLAPICAWVAIRGPAVLEHFSDLFIPVLLSFAVAAWVSGFDIIYACQDEAFDRQTGLHSLPVVLGTRGALRIAAAAHGMMLLLLVGLTLVGRSLGLGWVFGGAVGLTALLVIFQHRLVHPLDLAKVNLAFFNVNAIISMLLLAAGTVDCFWV